MKRYLVCLKEQHQSTRRNFLVQKRKTSDDGNYWTLFSTRKSGYKEHTSSSCWWLKKRFPLSSRSGSRSSSLDQENPEPPHIEEQEELCTSQEGKQRQGLEEADVKFSFTPVRSEEEEAQSPQLHQRQTKPMETEDDGNDCGGPEPERNLDPDRHPEPDTDETTGDSSDTDDSSDWKETREPQSRLNSLKPDDVRVSDSRCSAGAKLFRCSECEKTFGNSGHHKIHMRTHTGEKPFSCSVCGNRFVRNAYLKVHMKTHTRNNPV